MKIKRLCRRIGSFFRLKKPIDNTSEFIKKLEAVDALERDGKLLVSCAEGKPGIVLNAELSNYFNHCYVVRMTHYTNKYGLENFLNARHRLKKFAQNHNPDEELLNLCMNARNVINFRRAAHVDGHYADKDASEYELMDDEPLYITFMNDDLSAATHIGYEKNGEIELRSVDKENAE